MNIQAWRGTEAGAVGATAAVSGHALRCRADVSAVICFLQTENDLFFYLHEERGKSYPIISGHSRCILLPAVNWYT